MRPSGAIWIVDVYDGVFETGCPLKFPEMLAAVSCTVPMPLASTLATFHDRVSVMVPLRGPDWDPDRIVPSMVMESAYVKVWPVGNDIDRAVAWLPLD